MKGKYKRAYFVDLGYQLPQLVAGVIAIVLVALLLAGLLSWFYLLAWDGSIAYHHNRLIPVYVLSLILVVAVVMAIFNLRRSREIAGMMKKLQRLLEDASQGTFPEQEVTFRKSDYFAPLASSLNACLRQLRVTQASIKNQGPADLVSLADETKKLGKRVEALSQICTDLQKKLVERGK